MFRKKGKNYKDYEYSEEAIEVLEPLVDDDPPSQRMSENCIKNLLQKAKEEELDVNYTKADLQEVSLLAGNGQLEETNYSEPHNKFSALEISPAETKTLKFKMNLAQPVNKFSKTSTKPANSSKEQEEQPSPPVMCEIFRNCFTR